MADLYFPAIDPAARSGVNQLPGMLAARREITTNPLSHQVLAAPPVITEANGSATTFGGTSQGAVNDQTKFKWVCVGGPTAGSGGTAGYYSGSRSSADLVIFETMSDSAIIEFRILNFTTQLDIKVDGQPIQAGIISTTGSGGHLIKIDWSAATGSNDPEPNRPRKYQLAGQNLYIAAVYTQAAASCWLPDTHPDRKLMAVFGDSYTQITGALYMRKHVAPLVSELLGFDHWHDGTGSTGWNSAGANAPVTRMTERIGALNRTPDYLLTLMGYNDNATGDLTPHAANVDAFIAEARRIYPAIKIFIAGPWTPNLPTGATGLAAVKTMLQARADANQCPFIDIDGIVTAANKGLYTGGDNVHPTNLGHSFLGQRIARKIATYL